MDFSEERFQRCKGRLGNLTQTGDEVITAKVISQTCSIKKRKQNFNISLY